MNQHAAHNGGEHQELLSALAGHHAQAGLAVGERTRRAVRNFTLDREERRETTRRNFGLAAFAGLGLLMLLAPALWSSVDDFFGGEHFADLHTQVTLLLLVLFMAVLAALLAGWHTQNAESRERDL